MTYWVISDEEDEDGAVSSNRRRLPRFTCYTLIIAAAIILCGLLATLWIWTRYGSSGFPHKGGKASGSDMRPGIASLVLGPAITMVGVVCIIVACVIHEVKQKRENEVQMRMNEILFDPLVSGDNV